MPPNSSQSSFIPKRGATREKRRKPAKRIFVFSLIAYSLVFASLLASGASYLYKNYTTSILQNEVSRLNAEIGTFSVSDLSVITEFDTTLQRAESRLTNAASIVTALDAIDVATAEPVQINSLSMERSGDEYMLLTAEVTAQSFDSALFQRKLLNMDQRLFSEVVVEDVSIIAAANEDGQAGATGSLIDQPVIFTTTMRVPIDSLPYRVPQQTEAGIPEVTDNQTAL